MPDPKYTINVDTAQAIAALRQLRQDAAQTEATLKQLTARGYTMSSGGLSGDKTATGYKAEFELNRVLERGIAVKQQASQAYEGYKKQFPQLIDGLEKQAAIQGGSVIPSTVRLSTTTDTLTGKMVTHASAQTQLNNGLTGHVNTMDKAAQGISRYTSLLTKMAFSMIVWEGFQAVTQSIGEVIDKQREYSLETTRFAAITDQSVSQATDAWNRFADIGVEFGVKPGELGGTMRTAQLSQGTDSEKNQYVETVSKLQAVTGAQADTISKSIYSVLQQADMGLGEVGKLGDQVIATLQKMPNIEIDQVFAAMQEAPSLAKLWGTSFEDAFNIIVEGASRAQESPEQMATAFQRLSQGINSLSEGGSEAYERIEKLRESFDFDIAPGGKMLSMLDALGMAAEKLPTLDSTQQQEFLQALSGGSIRPEQMRNLVGGIDAFTIQLGQSFDKLTGTLDEAAQKLEGSWGQINAKMEAGIEKLKMTGTVGQNLDINVLKATVGQLGAGGAEYVSYRVKAANMQNLFGTEGAVGKNKADFIKSLYGLSPEEAEKAIIEYHGELATAARGATIANPINTNMPDIQEQFEKGVITSAEISEVMRLAGENAGKQYTDGVKNALVGLKDVGGLVASILGEQGTKAIQDQLGNLSSALFGKNLITPEVSEKKPIAQAERSFPGGVLGQLGREEYTTAFRRGPEGGMSGLTGESVLDRAGEVDLTKNTEQEIVTARQLALDLARQDIQAQREFYAAIGLTKEEIDKIIEARQEEIDATITLVKTQQGLNYEIGAQGKYLQEAMRQQEQAEKAKKSDFQFKRLKDVDPSQFGQLQALTQMYDKFLTNIGSPEKKQNINLLLGEQNVFKTMNGRMTALAMALEDLTKVEKAQLSGTWNMPAGATALVPISSLDIQRWNKADSGGLSAEALMALMGATTESGDTVAQSQQEAATRIIQAIYDAMTREGLPTDKLKEAKTPAEAVKAAQEAVANRVNEATAWKDDILSKIRAMGGEKGSTPDLESITNLFKMVAQNASRPSGIGGRGLIGGGGGGDAMDGKEKVSDKLSDMADKKAVPNVQVTVSSTPIKATFNANIMVNLNGYIVARALVPILFSMLTKTSASSGQRPQGVQR